MLKHLFVFAAIFMALIPFRIHAQDNLRWYRTYHHDKLISTQSPDYHANKVAIEQQYRDFQYYGSEKNIVIPLVFHFVLPENVQISAEAINTQIQSLNDDFSGFTLKEQSVLDFSGHFYDSITLAARQELIARASEDSGISFCIGVSQQPGNPALGVEQITRAGVVWSEDDQVKSLGKGGLDPWNPQQYLNIWVCALPDSISGYAQMPGGDWSTDGIVVDYRLFGTKVSNAANPSAYDKGKTLTHLIGNYLNLYDLWGHAYRCQDDNVEDTPVHNAPNFGDPFARHISTCDGFPVEMVMNFMDASDDTGQYMFTRGQVKRMQAVLAENGWRAALGQSSPDVICSATPLTENMIQARNKEQQETLKASFEVLIAPNPAADAFNITVVAPEDAQAELKIMNSSGQLISLRQQRFLKGVSVVPVYCSDWPRGLYFLSVRTENAVLQKRIALE
ncbi:MAG: zinc-dependent metalloprotease [Chitinophagales bacterium]|nr:zinc-dependent metalloprotease [Chitinophagales bacterium]